MLIKVKKRDKRVKRHNRRTERYHRLKVDLAFTEYYEDAIFNP